MAISAEDVEVLHQYAEGVMNRADHHAGQVKAIALAILGAIVWRASPGTISIKQYNGGLANILWAVIEEKKYAFAYNHETEKIEVRDRTINGSVLAEFCNQTPIVEIEHFFRNLS
ncbi:hypothetical protein [uncultured Cohaesibacter sp.]|uniref:hypothetical protein n=1 Tax=uncultured Cohaesibacter sp. TaxID=1002546 RepID=UPI0029C85AAC|nr:hypothetical protein [uncultured Cohaesibacter sp.]